MTGAITLKAYSTNNLPQTQSFPIGRLSPDVRATVFLLPNWAMISWPAGNWSNGIFALVHKGPRGPWFEPRPVHISLWHWASHIYLA